MNPKRIWNGWTRNYSGRKDGFIIHAFDEDTCRIRREFRSVCGVRLWDSGLLNLHDYDWKPGCGKCRRILMKAGMIKSGPCSGLINRGKLVVREGEKKSEKTSCAQPEVVPS